MVYFKTNDDLLIPSEFQIKMDGFQELKRTFEALAPGRKKILQTFFRSQTTYNQIGENRKVYSNNTQGEWITRQIQVFDFLFQEI